MSLCSTVPASTTASAASWSPPGGASPASRTLRQAHGTLSSVGAVAYLERVEADLASSGITSLKRSASPWR